ncbi:HlyD family secretion protein [Pseudomonas aeruginosa]|nr:HlyD family secretion protein [Pseudomonas aeruginosa]
MNLVDRIHSGLPVEMLFTAFKQSKTPRVTGEVTVVAPTACSTSRTSSLYTLRAQVDAAAMGKLKGPADPPGDGGAGVRPHRRALAAQLPVSPLFDRAYVALAEN